MLGEERSAISTGTAREATMERSPKSRAFIRKKLMMIRQMREKKKSTSNKKDIELFDQTKEEERDATSAEAPRQQKSSMKPSLDFDERESTNETQGYGCFLSPIFMREEYNEENPSDRLILKSTISLDEKLSSSHTTNFHVRLSIGQMIGLKTDENLKRTKQSTSNRLVVGFVELLSSGKYAALSQPLLTNTVEIQKPRAIVWANHHEGEEKSQSESRGCLYFSLSLRRECSDNGSYEGTDDYDDSSVYSYVPEVVKLLVGLKCGDERIPLGVAKFVVNGRETFKQNMDLIVLPVSDLAAGYKTKRAIFGKKQRNSFNNGQFAYTITRSAKLSITADVRVVYPGQNGEEIWGDEDCSYASAFDASGLYSSQSNHSLSFRKQPKEDDRKFRSVDSNSFISKTNQRQDFNDVPMRVIGIDRSNELVSVSSDISSRPGHARLWVCEPLLCTGFATEFSREQNRELHREDLSFESNEVMENEVESFNEELRSVNFSGDSSWGS